MGALCICIGDVKRDDDDGLVFEVGFYHEDVFFNVSSHFFPSLLFSSPFPSTLFLLSRSFSCFHALSLTLSPPTPPKTRTRVVG